MELRELAQRVLFSASLGDKLAFQDGALTDQRPGPALAEAPVAPGRPKQLRMDDGRPRATFPKTSHLHKPEARGIALHFFANHELLAAELMALCLLRFPKAPPGFRMGVARTLLEEQEHLRTYRARMDELGVSLGDVPMNGNFWRRLAPMSTPLHYVAGMSLVFEQANLDHAGAWVLHFRECEDHRSSKIMQKVLEDEIGHVRHGATWFERLRNDGGEDCTSSFDAFAKALPSHLDPVRAKGRVMLREARLKAGLSIEFVDALEAHRGFKGRRPKLWVFSPETEDVLAGRKTSAETVQKLRSDLASVFGFLGSSDDAVWSSQAPSLQHQRQLDHIGLPTPKTVASAAEARALWPDSIEFWGLKSELAESVLSAARVTPVPLDPALFDKRGLPELRSRWVERGWSNRSWAGFTTRSLRQIEVEASKGAVLVKAPWSAAGRHRRRLVGPLSEDDRRWLTRRLQQSSVLVEPWLQRMADFSFVRFPNRKPAFLRFYTDEKGAYRGHQLAKSTAQTSSQDSLPPAALELLHRHPAGGLSGLLEALDELTRLWGVPEDRPAGVDLMIARHRESGSVGLHLCEVNARWTMGHIAAQIVRRLAPGTVGYWLHAKAPMQPKPSEDPVVRDGKLASGLLCTNPPETAQAVVTAVVAAPTLEQARKQWALVTQLGAV